ncbi:hypothetical protein D3C76_1750610 [compost metagenome]
MIVCLGGSQLIDMDNFLLRLLGFPVEIFILVPCTDLLSFRAGPIVGYQDNNRIVELPDFPERIQEPADMIIGMVQKACEHLLHSCK